MEKTYVVLIRNKVVADDAVDYVNIFTQDEAVKANWVSEDGERIWVFPPKDEYSNTFVWEFTDPDKAVDFYTMLTTAAVGIKTVAN